MPSGDVIQKGCRRRQAGRVFWPFALLLGVLGALVLFGVLELIAQRALSKSGIPIYAWGWSSAEGLAPAQPWDEASQTLTYLDPLLGFALDPRALGKRFSRDGIDVIDGFMIHEEPPGDGEPLRLVILGGSTTAPDTATWVPELAGLLRRDGRRVRIFNGGVPGYSSSQDLLKLIRDGVGLEPDIVIALQGVNDFRFLHGVPDQPMVHPYGVTILEYAGALKIDGPLPNLRRLATEWGGRDEWRVRGINLGPPLALSPAESWMKNMRAAHAISDEFGIDYLVGIQPMVGVGDFSPNAREQSLLDELEAKPAYLERMRGFYEQVGELAGREDFVVDLTDAFAGESGVYSDRRHQTPAGGRILADAIYAELKRRGWLDRNARGSGDPR